MELHHEMAATKLISVYKKCAYYLGLFNCRIDSFVGDQKLNSNDATNYGLLKIKPENLLYYVYFTRRDNRKHIKPLIA